MNTSEEHEADKYLKLLICFISPTGFVTDHTDFIRDYNKIELRN